MWADSQVLIPYRLWTVRVGTKATVLALVALAVYPFLPGHLTPQPWGYAVVLGAAAGGLAVVHALPWERLFSSGRGIWFLYAWSVGDILLITVGAAVTAGGRSELFLLYYLTTIFFALSYPVPGQIGLLIFTMACYLGVLVVWGPMPPAASVFVRLAMLGVVAFLPSVLSRQLIEEMAASRAVSAESQRRARLLAAVASAARRMTVLDPDGVLKNVVDATEELGFEVAGMCILDETSATYRVAHARGLPDSYTKDAQPTSGGVIALVLNKRSTVVVDEYSAHPMAVPALKQLGLCAVGGAPVWSQGRLTAALVVGTSESRSLSAQEVEALELLAAQAGRGLEIARRFEDERRTVQQLAELDRMKSDFLSTVSHELRTPLTVIKGMGQTLEQRGEHLDSLVRHELMQRLNANAVALDAIIDTLLDFGRLEAGRLEVRARDVDAGALLARVARRLESLFCDHVFTTRIDDGLLVRADPVLLERVVENLLSNASKHTPPGTHVLLSGERSRDQVVVAVTDDGPGIPEREVRHLGDRFFRGGDPNTRTSRGLGLGLALVGEVLRLHGSTLDVDSRVGLGSRFSFRMAALQSSSAAFRADATSV